MKQLLKRTILGSFIALTVSPAYAGIFNLGIHIGGRDRLIDARPAAPIYEPPLVTTERPRMVYASDLGMYVAVGVPYEMCYLQNSYYLYRDGRWSRGRSSRGPWVAISSCDLPRSLRSQRIEDFREYRQGWQRRNLRERDCDDHGEIRLIADGRDHRRDVPREWQRPWQKQDREWSRR